MGLPNTLVGGLSVPYGSGGLNDNLYECTIKINAGATGTLEVAQQGGGFIDPDTYEVRLNGYEDGIDAVCWEMDGTGTYRLNELAEDAGGDPVLVKLSGADNRTFDFVDALGNPTAPVAYPVTISFVILATAKAVRRINWSTVLQSTPYYDGGGGGAVLSDGVTIDGDGTLGNELEFMLTDELDFALVNAFKYI